MKRPQRARPGTLKREIHNRRAHLTPIDPLMRVVCLLIDVRATTVSSTAPLAKRGRE